MKHLLLSLALSLTLSEVQAHGGGLNAEGCHNNRKTGDYHCHRAPVAKTASRQPTVPSPQLAGSEGRVTRPATPTGAAGGGVANSSRPTCYTGPRGGRYTITASGRKNYKGC